MQFIYKPNKSTEKLFIMTKFEWKSNALAMHVEERGWVKAKILLTNR